MADVMSDSAWLPYSVSEAAVDGHVTDVKEPRDAWAHLLTRLGEAAELTSADPVIGNERDLVAGYRHLLVLLAVGLEEALYDGVAPELSVRPTSTDDILTWGMECPDCLYTRANLRGGESYLLRGNRGTARYVGLQTMDGIASTANVLVDELEVDKFGDFAVVLSAKPHDGNWLELSGEHPNLVVRHFFYDWDTEVPSNLTLERIGDTAPATATSADSGQVIASRVAALGDFVKSNLAFFQAFGGAAAPNTFMPPLDGTKMGAAAENRPVIGKWQLQPDEALILEVVPPVGVYWSLSLGNPWLETVNYGRHQSSLNGHQAVIDPDGVFRAVIAGSDPGVANWVDTAGHSNGCMILRCVRTETAPVPDLRVVKLADVLAELPAETELVTPEERAGTIAARRRAVDTRFGR
jgi:hypothetical protein